MIPIGWIIAGLALFVGSVAVGAIAIVMLFRITQQQRQRLEMWKVCQRQENPRGEGSH